MKVNKNLPLMKVNKNLPPIKCWNTKTSRTSIVAPGLFGPCQTHTLLLTMFKLDAIPSLATRSQQRCSYDFLNSAAMLAAGSTKNQMYKTKLAQFFHPPRVNTQPRIQHICVVAKIWLDHVRAEFKPLGASSFLGFVSFRCCVSFERRSAHHFSAVLSRCA